jgi:hypothetical protein
MKPNFIIGGITSLLAACGPSAPEKRFQQAMSDSVITESPSYLISEHYIKGKTKDLPSAVGFLEMYTKQRNGYVERSETTREILGEHKIQLSADTAALISNYRMVADLTLRIPFYLLDSSLYHANALLSYVDKRTLQNHKAEVELIGAELNQITHENLANNLNENNPKTPATPANALVRTEKTESHLLAANEALVSKLNLQEKITYATLHVSLYEEEKTQVERHVILEELTPYEPPFYHKIWTSFKIGAIGLEKIILGLVSLWAWILGAWIIYKYYYNWRRNFSK